MISAGVFIVSPMVIDYVSDTSSFSMLEKDVIPALIKKEKVAGYTFDGRWFDIATPEIYERVLQYWKNKS